MGTRMTSARSNCDPDCDRRCAVHWSRSWRICALSGHVKLATPGTPPFECTSAAVCAQMTAAAAAAEAHLCLPVKGQIPSFVLHLVVNYHPPATCADTVAMLE